ncbi:MAG: hypothetical protein EZS26_003136, partial [Candidatus Ordinivivax streblomastigis]
SKKDILEKHVDTLAQMENEIQDDNVFYISRMLTSYERGFLEELDAMIEILKESRTASLFYGFVFAFLMSLELFVVTSKFGDKKCDYDLIVEYQLNVKSTALGELVKNLKVES